MSSLLAIINSGLEQKECEYLHLRNLFVPVNKWINFTTQPFKDWLNSVTQNTVYLLEVGILVWCHYLKYQSLVIQVS